MTTPTAPGSRPPCPGSITTLGGTITGLPLKFSAADLTIGTAASTRSAGVGAVVLAKAGEKSMASRERLLPGGGGSSTPRQPLCKLSAEAESKKTLV